MNKKLLPLTLLHEAETDEMDGITRFQKLVFLAQEEGEIEEGYDFVPHSYGPFSKALYDDIDRLVDEGFVEEGEEQTAESADNDKQVYRLTEDGRQVVEHAANGGDELDMPEELEASVRATLGDYEDTDLYELLKYVYSEHPGMAKNSKLNI